MINESGDSAAQLAAREALHELNVLRNELSLHDAALVGDLPEEAARIADDLLDLIHDDKVRPDIVQAMRNLTSRAREIARAD